MYSAGGKKTLDILFYKKEMKNGEVEIKKRFSANLKKSVVFFFVQYILGKNLPCRVIVNHVHTVMLIYQVHSVIDDKISSQKNDVRLPALPLFLRFTYT